MDQNLDMNYDRYGGPVTYLLRGLEWYARKGLNRGEIAKALDANRGTLARWNERPDLLFTFENMQKLATHWPEVSYTGLTVYVGLFPRSAYSGTDVPPEPEEAPEPPPSRVVRHRP